MSNAVPRAIYSREKANLHYFGNKEIINLHKTAFLCSRKCQADVILKSLDWAKSKKDRGECVISCFHSKIEKDVFDILLKGIKDKKNRDICMRIIFC